MYMLKNKNILTALDARQSSKCLTTINPITPTREQKQRNSDFAQTENGRSRQHPRHSPPAMMPVCYIGYSQVNQVPCSGSFLSHSCFKSPFQELTQDVEEKREHGKWAVDITVVDNELGGFVFLCYFSSCPWKPGSF